MFGMTTTQALDARSVNERVAPIVMEMLQTIPIQMLHEVALPVIALTLTQVCAGAALAMADSRGGLTAVARLREDLGAMLQALGTYLQEATPAEYAQDSEAVLTCAMRTATGTVPEEAMDEPEEGPTH